MELLEGKSVCKNIELTFERRINVLKENGIFPRLSVLGIKGDDASRVYVNRIEKNCNKYGIACDIHICDTEDEFIRVFNNDKDDDNITGIMFQQPLPSSLNKFIDFIPVNKDVEGITYYNIGKLMLGYDDALIPCTSKAVIEIINYYNIDLTGKKVCVVGRSNIVGKPLIPQLLSLNASVCVCHSKTSDLVSILKESDVVVMAIGRANYLKSEWLKKDAIVLDVGINFVDGNIVGDTCLDGLSDVCKSYTPVPGGVGTVTNMLLIDNVIKSCENILNK